MMVASVKTMAGAVRFLGLFIVYVAALTAMGVVRAGRTSVQWVSGLFSDSGSDPSPGRTPDVDATGSPHPTADEDGIEESTTP